MADKADDTTIEHMHQILQRLRDQFRRVRSYQQRETGIKKALRRYRHPDIVQVMEEFAEKKRRSEESHEETIGSRGKGRPGTCPEEAALIVHGVGSVA